VTLGTAVSALQLVVHVLFRPLVIRE